MTTASKSRSPRSLSSGVFLLSLGLLLFELCLTRVLSVLYYYHTAFLAISVAMLGLGAGGLWVHLRPRLFAGRQAVLLTATMGSMALLPFLFPVVHLDLEELKQFFGGAFLLSIGLTVIVCALPFLGGGAVLALILAENRGRVARLYAADLIGAAAGTLALVPVMGWLGGPGALFGCGVLVGLASFLLCGARGAWPRALALLALVALTVFQAGTERFTIDVDLGAEGKPVLARRWNAFSRVIAVEGQGWDRGLSQDRLEEIEGRLAPQIEALIDINAFAPLVRFDGDLGRVDYLRDTVSNLGYHLLERGMRVAILGPGGGKDVLGALLFEPERIVGFELNPILVDDFVRGRFREFTGNLYGRPDVEILVGDARAGLQGLGERFDLIVANSVATWAAHSAGAMNLAEQGLFTDAAFALYKKRLRPGGILSISLWDEQRHALPLRLLSTWARATRGSGTPPLSACVAVVGNRWDENRWFTTLLIGSEPFDVEQTDRLEDLAAELGFDPLYIPGGSGSTPLFEEYFADPAGFRKRSRRDLTAATDDRPFLFYTLRWRDALRFWDPDTRSENVAYFSLVASLGVVGLLVALVFALPIWRTRGRAAALDGRGMAYFGALGGGFLFVEIAIIQRLTLLLGHPTYALTVALFGILAWSALGSRLAGRMLPDRARHLRGVLAALVLVLGLTWWTLFGWLQPSLASLATAPRIAAVLIALAPAGLLMGVPMPVGLHVIGDRPGHAIPLAWGVNGATSVLASVLAILLAIQFGLRATLLAGMLSYLLALCAWRRPRGGLVVRGNSYDAPRRGPEPAARFPDHAGEANRPPRS